MNHVVYDSKRADARRGFDITDSDYIDGDWVLRQRELQDNRCYYCDRKMQIKRRNTFDGLQAERLTESLGHLKSTCVLACGNCNWRSYNRQFCPYPIKDAIELGFDLDENHCFRGTPPTHLPSRLWIYQERQREMGERYPPQE